MLIGRHFGHIRVTEVVGQGGMGDVYGGYDEKLERKVALKVLNDDQRLDDEARERLLREARALSKLDHPNICRIHDYIETPDLDLLVLEYIDGQTLHDAMQSGISHHEKLRIAVAIADVLVQAHRAGIIHRDLKPENVMLTKSGEVKVLDFGLARWLHHRRKSSDKYVAVRSSMRAAVADAAETTKFSFDEVPRDSAPRRDFLATAVGMTLGTPLFMSPEQARGETLTPASDMFSFGLLLQTLVTGDEPHPADLTAREVMLRVARGETQPVKGAPGDVTTLINRLKQLAPADRPTAVETAEKLRFLVAKPQRIARRAIAAAVALVLLVGVWRYLVDLKRERAIAVEARADAVERRAEAENLMEFMLGDLRRKLEPVGRLDILDDVAERAMTYSKSLEPAKMSADELSRSSKALNQLGEVRVAQGKLSEASTIFRRSLEFAQYAAKRDPASARAQLAVATANFWVGDVYRQEGKLDDALRHYTTYMTVAEQLAKQYPENDEYRLERGYGHSVVAAVFERKGDFPRAIPHLQLTREIKEERLAANPGDVDRQADLARTLNRIGFVLESSGDLRGARSHYEREFATYSKLAAADPRNSRWKDRLVTSHSYLGSLLEMTGEVDAALAHRFDNLALTRELSARDPQNALWQRDLAVSQMGYGIALRLVGRPAESLTEFRKAERTLRPLLERKETVWSWHRDLAVIQTNMARTYLALGNGTEAIRSATAAIDRLESIAASDEAMPRHLALGHLALGDAWDAMGDRKRAVQEWEKAAATVASVTRGGQGPSVLDIRARTLIRLGRREEAAPFINELNGIGYRAPDFMSAISPNAERRNS
jgi:tetratricopeptide (TPR) repeat protein/tRNA A-37 threonylcarbamoyl transferase component Bud32